MARAKSKKKTSFFSEDVKAILAYRFVQFLGLGLMALALLGALAFLTYVPSDPSFNTAGNDRAQNLLGIWGASWADLWLQSLGLASIFLLFIIASWGWRVWRHHGTDYLSFRLMAIPLALCVWALLGGALPAPSLWPLEAGLGGLIGDLGQSHFLPLLDILNPYQNLALGFVALLLGAALLAPASGLTREAWQNIGAAITAAARFIANETIWAAVFLFHLCQNAFFWIREQMDRDDAREETEPRPKPVKRKKPVKEKSEEEEIPVQKITKTPKKGARKKASAPYQQKLSLSTDQDFNLPPIDLLAEAEESDAPQQDSALQQNAQLLESVLQDFGVEGKIVKVRPGPVVTLYELEPAPGIKSSRIIGLADDIARSMSAVSVRIAVIPGKNVLGIELPNKKRQKVFLRELLESEDYQESSFQLPLILGKDIGGVSILADLARMPHLLIAGTTGSGKSVGINTMIMSLLYRFSPEECRLIMIDPKMLELSIYDDIPHLLAPVVTDPGKAVVALKWAVKEMENRYRAMSQLGVRNIQGYNQRIQQAREKGEVLNRRVQTGFDPETGKPVYEDQTLDLKALPYIVVIVDEMADLMLVAGKDVESAIQRLAQMARAAGIHLIMATQRPSVDVITGTIKANFPTRISFQVTSKIDSRTILGESGAELLLGQGDMLYMAGGGRITRVHGPFVSDEEVEEIVSFIKNQGEPEYQEDITIDDEAGSDSGEGGAANDEPIDPLYDEAVAMVCRDGKASTSYVQRKFSIGYNRAARIVERMEEEGIVSAPTAAGRREVLGK